MVEYPYMISNNKIAPIISSLQSAAKPPKFTLEFLRNLGFASTNDRAIVPLFKKLDFLSEDGTPTVYYDQLRDATTSQQIMAARIRGLYSDLFTINTQICNDSEASVKGAISRVTGGDETSVTRVYNTFKTLCSLADFTQSPSVTEENAQPESPTIENPTMEVPIPHLPDMGFHYNFQIHLPATTDISVYNAIFKSLKDNLIV